MEHTSKPLDPSPDPAVERLIEALVDCGDCYAIQKCRVLWPGEHRRWCEFCRMRAAVDALNALSK